MATSDDASGDLPVTGSLVVPAAALSWRFSRSSGPGGQGVNTADSRVELSFDLGRSPSFPQHLRKRAERRLTGRLVDGVLTVVASEHRSQLRNRDAARARLAALLRVWPAGPIPAGAILTGLLASAGYLWLAVGITEDDAGGDPRRATGWDVSAWNVTAWDVALVLLAASVAVQVTAPLGA